VSGCGSDDDEPDEHDDPDVDWDASGPKNDPQSGPLPRTEGDNPRRRAVRPARTYNTIHTMRTTAATSSTQTHVTQVTITPPIKPTADNRPKLDLGKLEPENGPQVSKIRASRWAARTNATLRSVSRLYRRCSAGWDTFPGH
jgi:hypothetical protein